MRDKTDFANYQEKLSYIQSNDRFYQEKFRKLQFRVPYTISFFRNLSRNMKLFHALIKRAIKRALGKSDNVIEDQPFRYIMESNIQIAHKLYQEKYSQDLFRALVNEFISYAISEKHKPIFVIIPQLVDFHVLNKIGSDGYSDFINNMGIPDSQILDFTKSFSKIINLGDYYVNDKYGGHISKKGNKYIANILAAKLEDIIERKKKCE